jgi:hypothetical protein
MADQEPTQAERRAAWVAQEDGVRTAITIAGAFSRLVEPDDPRTPVEMHEEAMTFLSVLSSEGRQIQERHGGQLGRDALLIGLARIAGAAADVAAFHSGKPREAVLNDLLFAAITEQRPDPRG